MLREGTGQHQTGAVHAGAMFAGKWLSLGSCKGDNRPQSLQRWQPTCQARDSGVSGAPPSAASLSE